MTDQKAVRAAAQAAHKAGLCVLPPREDGSKRPRIGWKKYQQQQSTVEDIDTWYRSGRRYGLGVVTGRVSGDLEVFEFDCPDTYREFGEAAAAAGLGALVERIEAGYCEDTPSGGVHWLYRSPLIEGNGKLARRPKRPEEMQDANDKTKTLIETRGEGGYCILAPSGGKVHPSGRPYVLRSGSLATIPTISAMERASLFELARSFDQTPQPAPVTPPAATVIAAAEAGGRPGDEWAAKTSWADILKPKHWALTYQRGGIAYWRRPGKETPGISATTRTDGGLWVFTTSTDFEPEKPYSKFGAYAVLNHGGDFKAAARALAEQGYGQHKEKKTGEPREQGPAEHAPAGLSAAPPANLPDLLTAMRAYLHLEDEGHVKFTLAVAVSAELDGDPLWGMLVGASSGGKTEAIRALEDLGEHVDELSSPGLLSWTSGKHPRATGVLTRITRGLLTIGDFSTVLASSSASGKDREALFAALRRVYDGSFTRDLGNAPHPLHWSGRLTILAACTPSIDNYAAHADALGPRWLYYRLPRENRKAEKLRQRKARAEGPRIDQHRKEVRRLAADVVRAARQQAGELEVPDHLADAIDDAAYVACQGRAVVPRSAYGRRDILGLPVVESTPRITGQLLMLARCLLALGQAEAEVLALCRRAALDSMPEIRHRVLDLLAQGEQVTGRQVARAVGCHPNVATTTLEDLEAIGIAEFEQEEQEPDDFPAPVLWMLTEPDAALITSVFAGQPVHEVEEITPPPPHIARGEPDGHHQ